MAQQKIEQLSQELLKDVPELHAIITPELMEAHKTVDAWKKAGSRASNAPVEALVTSIEGCDALGRHLITMFRAAAAGKKQDWLPSLCKVRDYAATFSDWTTKGAIAFFAIGVGAGLDVGVLEPKWERMQAVQEENERLWKELKITVNVYEALEKRT